MVKHVDDDESGCRLIAFEVCSMERNPTYKNSLRLAPFFIDCKNCNFVRLNAVVCRIDGACLETPSAVCISLTSGRSYAIVWAYVNSANRFS